MKKYFLCFLLIIFFYQLAFCQNNNTSTKLDLDTTDFINYIKYIKSNLTPNEYRLALKKSYKLNETDLRLNSFYLNRFRAIVHSELHRADSAIFYATKTINKHEKIQPYEMIDPYGILAFNHYKYGENNKAFKYMELAVETMKLAKLPNNEFVRLSRKYWLAGIVRFQSESVKKNNYKNTSIIIIISALAIISMIVLYYRRKRKKLLLKTELFEIRLTHLETPKKRSSHNTIDNEIVNRILNELSVIENSELFLDKDFNLALLAKHLNTNTAYLSKIVNQYKGKTFKQYLIELRIKVLLENLEKNPVLRKYSIEALAQSIGYNNASSFTRIFKNYLGESPSAFLKKRYPMDSNN